MSSKCKGCGKKFKKKIHNQTFCSTKCTNKNQNKNNSLKYKGMQAMVERVASGNAVFSELKPWIKGGARSQVFDALRRLGFRYCEQA